MVAPSKSKRCPYCAETIAFASLICRHCSKWQPEMGTRVCLYCAEPILRDAKKCKYCLEWMPESAHSMTAQYTYSLRGYPQEHSLSHHTNMHGQSHPQHLAIKNNAPIETKELNPTSPPTVLHRNRIESSPHQPLSPSSATSMNQSSASVQSTLESSHSNQMIQDPSKSTSFAHQQFASSFPRNNIQREANPTREKMHNQESLSKTPKQPTTALSKQPLASSSHSLGIENKSKNSITHTSEYGSNSLLIANSTEINPVHTEEIQPSEKNKTTQQHKEKKASLLKEKDEKKNDIALKKEQTHIALQSGSSSTNDKLGKSTTNDYIGFDATKLKKLKKALNPSKNREEKGPSNVSSVHSISSKGDLHQNKPIEILSKEILAKAGEEKENLVPPLNKKKDPSEPKKQLVDLAEPKKTIAPLITSLDPSIEDVDPIFEDIVQSLELDEYKMIEILSDLRGSFWMPLKDVLTICSYDNLKKCLLSLELSLVKEAFLQNPKKILSATLSRFELHIKELSPELTKCLDLTQAFPSEERKKELLAELQAPFRECLQRLESFDIALQECIDAFSSEEENQDGFQRPLFSKEHENAIQSFEEAKGIESLWSELREAFVQMNTLSEGNMRSALHKLEQKMHQFICQFEPTYSSILERTLEIWSDRLLHSLMLNKQD